MADKEFILGKLDDVVQDFLYYERKGDEDLPPGAIEEAVASRKLTIREMVAWFEVALRRQLDEPG